MRAALPVVNVCLAIAAAHAAPRSHTTVVPIGHVTSASTAACSKCGLGGHGVLNCCSSGGSWEGTCKDGGLHTWEEGQFACVKAAKPTEQQQEQARELDGLEAELKHANKRAQKAKEDLEQRKATQKSKHTTKHKTDDAPSSKVISKKTSGDENKWQDLSGLPDDADPRKCIAREGQTIGNGWCVMNCGGTPPNCPASLCCCAVAPGDCDVENKDASSLKAMKAAAKDDSDEVDAALQAFHAALEHASTDDARNATGDTNSINATEPSRSAAPKRFSPKGATKKLKEPAPSLNESEWQDLSGLPNGTDTTACVAVCGQKTADSHWCVTNCGGTPPNCPATLCTCAADAPNCEEEEAKAAKKAEKEAKAATKAAEQAEEAKVATQEAEAKATEQAEEAEAAKQAKEAKAIAKADAKASKEATNAKSLQKEVNATGNATGNATENATATEAASTDAVQAVRDWEAIRDWEPNETATLNGSTTPAAVGSTPSVAQATPSANESRWQDLTGLPEGANPAACKAVCGQKTADDKWCVMNCGGTPPNCPATLCTCAGNAPNCAEEEANAAKQAEIEAKATKKAEKTQAAKQAEEEKAAQKAEIVKAAKEAYKASKRVKEADEKEAKKRGGEPKRNHEMSCKDDPKLPHCGLNASAWQDLSGLPDGADPRECRAVVGNGAVDDKWCQKNCGGLPPNCPAALCCCLGNQTCQSSAPTTKSADGAESRVRQPKSTLQPERGDVPYPPPPSPLPPGWTLSSDDLGEEYRLAHPLPLQMPLPPEDGQDELTDCGLGCDQSKSALLKGMDPKLCGAIEGGSVTIDDDWCVKNCCSKPPHCPDDLCQCKFAEPDDPDDEATLSQPGGDGGELSPFAKAFDRKRPGSKTDTNTKSTNWMDWARTMSEKQRTKGDQGAVSELDRELQKEGIGAAASTYNYRGLNYHDSS